MWLIESLLRPFPESSVIGQIADLEIVRQQCNVQGLSWRRRIDINFQYLNLLLLHAQYNASPQLAEQVCLAVFNIAYGYEHMAQQIRESAYHSQKAAQWQSSTNYTKKAVGILLFVQTLPYIPTGLLSECKLYSSLYELSQQLALVVLTISKIRTQIYPDAADKYSKLLSFQDSDIEELAKSSMTYAKLSIGCCESCGSLQYTANARLSAQATNMERFLHSLSLTLVSLNKYQSGQYGQAVSMLQASISSLSPLLTREQLNMIHDYKSLNKLLTKTKSLKESMKSKLNSKSTNRANAVSLHPFILEIISDLLTPLMMVLQLRYRTANEFIVSKTSDSDAWVLPDGKLPETRGVHYVFEDNGLVEYPESNTLY